MVAIDKPCNSKSDFLKVYKYLLEFKNQLIHIET